MSFIRKTSFVAIEQAIGNGQRLTLKQGIALLTYAQAKDSKVQRLLEDCRRYEIDLDVLNEDYERLVRKWNELGHALDAILGIRVYSNEVDGKKEWLWTVEQNGAVVSKGHKSVGQAYTSILEQRLLMIDAGKQQEQKDA